MFKIRYVTDEDKNFWFTLDKYIGEWEFFLKVRDRRGYVLCDDDKPFGVMRYNLFWDSIPFLTYIYFEDAYRGKGLGKQAVMYWENELGKMGYKMVMTSTRVDEQAQHFYRKLGYQDRGSLFLEGTPLEQPQEMFMIKILKPAN